MQLLSEEVQVAFIAQVSLEELPARAALARPAGSRPGFRRSSM